ncbi:MAG: hypothetical protein HY832_03350 [Candidatus Aenigmarchaeota archaeon]|nr:hypothetical protein [Candidatus Aenigmarchaeota archaeon]
MAEIGDFEYFIVAGLLILALMLFAFNVNTLIPAKTGSTLIGADESSSPDRTIYLVGTTTQDTYKTSAYTINVENQRKTNIATPDMLNLQSGVLFGNDMFEYRIHAESADSILLEFEVKDTNGLEPLVVSIDGHVIVDRVLETGGYAFTIDKSMFSDDPKLEIYAKSSGWKLWAPAVYQIDNIKITTNGYMTQHFETIFSLDDELDTFTNGKIDLGLTQTIGTAVVKLNDRQIFRGPVNAVYSIPFDSTYLHKGLNTLTIEAAQDSLFTGTATLTLFYKDTSESVFQTPLNLTDDEINSFKTATIDFSMTDVKSTGGFIFRILSNNDIMFERFGTVEDGTQSFSIDQGVLKPGVNFVIVKAIGGAQFSLVDFAVTTHKE